MKQYLKMADVFADSAKKGTNLVCGKTLVAKFVDGVECEYSVHAINSHDELVQMNQELLAALERVVGDVRALANQSYGVHGLHQNGDLAPWGSLFAGGFFESWLLSVDDADAVIAKAKGGAV